MFALQNLHECKFTKLAQGRKGLSADEIDKVVGESSRARSSPLESESDASLVELMPHFLPEAIS
ncbi:hypothetical protein [Adlercreutzia mucosicola]|uniref:hypothetical protein n=1 Tax=Adlercreutzia mucosicola TaxID=580026 RepID=UPI0004839774|nr:hypothetical protein [Adlercreutzia mucosicola]